MNTTGISKFENSKDSTAMKMFHSSVFKTMVGNHDISYYRVSNSRAHIFLFFKIAKA